MRTSAKILRPAVIGLLSLSTVLSGSSALAQVDGPQAGVEIDAYVAAGLPVALSLPVSNQVASGSSFYLVPGLSFQVSSLTEPLTHLRLLLLEFDAQGKLRRVDGWARNQDLGPGKAVSITLSIDRRIRTGNRLVLTSDSVIGLDKLWEADLVGLSSAAAGFQVQNPKVSLLQDKFLAGDSGASLCSRGYRLAMLLGQAGDSTGITSYTCNQHERSFQFTFNGKFLGQ